MIKFLLPFFSCLFTFFSLIFTFRYMLSHRGYYWICPFILSLLLFGQDIYFLIESISKDGVFKLFYGITYLLIALLFFSSTQAFYSALKSEKKYDRYRDESKKIYNEAKYMDKTNRRRKRKNKNKELENNFLDI